MSRLLKCICYYIAKYSGLFLLTRRYYRHKIGILCYHGFSYHDEHIFRPKLFMAPALFSRRLELIKAAKFNVISLEQACQQLTSGQIEDNCVVITIDDGWFGVADFAAPLLAEHRFVATLYITTYYVQHRLPVVNLMVQYLLWKSTSPQADLSSLGEPFSDYRRVNCLEPQQQLSEFLTRFCEQLSTVSLRQQFLQRLGQLLVIDVKADEQCKMFMLIDDAATASIKKQGIDLQLHSHRHHIGEEDLRVIEREITDNISALRRHATTEQLRHFCYPSGFYTPMHQDYLAQHGMLSATTCEPGLCDVDTDLLSLPRFLDGQNISEIEFEAELYGFAQFMRAIKLKIKQVFQLVSPRPEYS